MLGNGMAKIPVLPIVGCLFWSLLLGLTALRLSAFGFSDDEYHNDYYLVGIPVGMIALTIAVWRFPADSRFYMAICAVSSCVALLAALYWAGFMTGGV